MTDGYGTGMTSETSPAAQLLAVALEQRIYVGMRVQEEADGSVLHLRIGGNGQMLSWARKLHAAEPLADAIEALSAVALEQCTRRPSKLVLAAVDGEAVAPPAAVSRHLFRKERPVSARG